MHSCDVTKEGFSCGIWIITRLFKPNARFIFIFSKCISALWVSRSVSNAVHAAALTVRKCLDIPKKTCNVLYVKTYMLFYIFFFFLDFAV